jgi:hypothetical protein
MYVIKEKEGRKRYLCKHVGYDCLLEKPSSEKLIYKFRSVNKAMQHLQNYIDRFNKHNSKKTKHENFKIEENINYGRS